MRDRAQGGFTLIELMVSLVLFSFAVAGVLAVAVSMTQGFRENRMTSVEEQSARVPMDFLTDALRQASPGVSDPTAVQDADTCQLGAITVTDGGTNGSDSLDVIYALGGVVTAVSQAYTAGTTLYVVDASNLAVGDRILVSNLSQGHLFTIAGVSTASVGYQLTLSSPCGSITLPAGGYPAGSLVIRAQHARFSIGTVDGVPMLMMDPDSDGAKPAEPIADGVEDLQVALLIDIDNDGAIGSDASSTTDEYIYNNASDTLPASGTTYRAVRVSLVARSVGQLVGAGTVSSRPALEDHTAGTADNYRRRVLRSTIEIRNGGSSP
ncbi:MAG TPA: PilW family protein [Kofleriaceae bacterium]|nr:PilW family protein [Kofleriaceae bacterium]